MHVPKALRDNDKTFPTERPDHGDSQVRRVEDIAVGSKYRKHYRSFSHVVTVLSAPVQRADGQWFVLVETPSWGNMEFSLADCGVTAYSRGTWNPTNWLERVED